jgi:hypothetical protein
LSGFTQQGVLPLQHALQSFAEIAQQMPTVGDLHSLGRGLPRSFGISIGTVTTDNGDTRMIQQPFSNAAGAPVW